MNLARIYLDSLSSPMLYPKQNMQDSVKIRKRNLKIGRGIVHVLSNMQNVVLWPFVNQGKEMNKEL